MTTIATDGKSMAGDGRIMRDGFISNDGWVKVVKAEDGSLIGTAGVASVGERFVLWWDNGRRLGGEWKHGPEANALVLTPEGKIIFFGDCGLGNECPAPQAIGSGSPYAIAAMLAGADARRAVEIASRLDPQSGGKITALSL